MQIDNYSTPISDSYECEKLKILQALNSQVYNMAVKLDKIVTQTEQAHFGIKLSSHYQLPPPPAPSSFLNTTGAFDLHLNFDNKPISQNLTSSGRADKRYKSNHSKAATVKQELETTNDVNNNNTSNTPAESKSYDSTAKRNKQQRQFNTFVRESINQLLGPDFMRTHDVQDIDAEVMEMIRKEATENYLPDNIRPRRAWHLAKASLRTLKRTLNNQKEPSTSNPQQHKASKSFGDQSNQQ